MDWWVRRGGPTADDGFGRLLSLDDLRHHPTEHVSSILHGERSVVGRRGPTVLGSIAESKDSKEEGRQDEMTELSTAQEETARESGAATVSGRRAE